MSKKKKVKENNQIHVMSVRGGVVLSVGDKRVFLVAQQADALGLELVRKADVARLLTRLATSGSL